MTTSPSHSQNQEQEPDLTTQTPQTQNQDQEQNLDAPQPISSLDEENQPQEQQHSPPQSPQTRTVEIPDPQIPEKQPVVDPQVQDPLVVIDQEVIPQVVLEQVVVSQVVLDQEDHEEENPPEQAEQTEGMSLSIDLEQIKIRHVIFTGPTPPLSLTSPTNQRRLNKRKKGGRNTKKQQAIEKKLQALTQNLNPIPFIPSKTLDFPKHEALLKRLGLWDFVNVKFDRAIRVDLIAQLIANYDPKGRCSYVNDARVNVNRADLAKAFKLPLKKGGGNAGEASNVVDLDLGTCSDEASGFIEDFISNWVLLHEDTWMMPNEVLNWTRVIKDGYPEKVEWAQLLWFMVEKELMQGEQLVDCYYASHLQHLIRSQKEILMREVAPEVEQDVEEVKEEEREVAPELEPDVEEVKEEEIGGAGDGDVKMVGADEPNIKLTLGQDVVEKEDIKDAEMMDADVSKDEDHGQWLLNGKNNKGDHFLQRCSVQENGGLGSIEEIKRENEDLQEEEEEEEEEIEGRYRMPDDDALERDVLTGNLLQGMEMAQAPFGLQGQLDDHSPMELLVSKDETYTTAAGPSIFPNNGKREIGHDQDMSHHSLNGASKRMRTHGPSDHISFDFGMCMDGMQQWMGKGTALYEAKEQALQTSQMNERILMGELQQRDSLIEHLNRAKFEELQKKQADIFRLERDLYLMGSLLEGYRKALKENQKAFSDYRERCMLPEKPVYEDAGPGGLVVSTTELKKIRQKQDEENRLVLEQKFKEAQEEYICKFEAFLDNVHALDGRLMNFENEVKLLKSAVKPKVSDLSEPGPSDEYNPTEKCNLTEEWTPTEAVTPTEGCPPTEGRPQTEGCTATKGCPSSECTPTEGCNLTEDCIPMEAVTPIEGCLPTEGNPPTEGCTATEGCPPSE